MQSYSINHNNNFTFIVQFRMFHSFISYIRPKIRSKILKFYILVNMDMQIQIFL